MKILKVLGAFFILLSTSSFAQLNKVPNLKLYDFEQLHFGFTLVGNQMDFVVKTKEDLYQMYFDSLPSDSDLAAAYAARVYGVTSNPSTGFAVGIVGDLRLGNYFNFRLIPTLSFGRRELIYDVRLYEEDGTFKSEKIINKKINTTFIEFPFLLKYKSMRVHNMRAYVIAGVKFNFDLASEANKEEKTNYDPKLYRTDTYGTLGAGLDIYMNWFKFGIELTMSYGMRDMLLREEKNRIYTESIETLRSKIFMLTFTFE